MSADKKSFSKWCASQLVTHGRQNVSDRQQSCKTFYSPRRHCTLHCPKVGQCAHCTRIHMHTHIHRYILVYMAKGCHSSHSSIKRKGISRCIFRPQLNLARNMCTLCTCPHESSPVGKHLQGTQGRAGRGCVGCQGVGAIIWRESMRM